MGTPLQMEEFAEMMLKTFNDIAELDDRVFAAWMERVDPRTLCTALHDSSDALRDRIMGGLSRFAKKLLDQEMSLIPRLTPELIGQSQQELLELALCVNDGEEILSRPKTSEGRYAVSDPVRIETEEKDRLVDTLIRLAEKSQKYGLLALEEDLQEIEDSLLKDGLEYVVAGVDPEFVKDVLHTRLTYLEDEYRRWAREMKEQARLELSRRLRERESAVKDEILRGEIVVEALLSLREGENPILLRERLRAFLPHLWKRSDHNRSDSSDQ